MRHVGICQCIALSLLSLLAACGSSGVRPAETDPQISLRVMTFNIEWGGTHVSFDNVKEAIRLSQADIVGIQEAEGNLQRLADDLGWHYDLRNYVISKYPLIDPPGADGRYVFVEVLPGKFVAIANVHLPSDPYGPDAVRDGASVAEVLGIERRARFSKILPVLDSLRPLIGQRTPLFLTGDFNAPAHTDWTSTMVGARPFLRYVVPWPVSLAIAGAGFHDSWRDVHADVRAAPGLTWWAARPPLADYTPGENDPQDRIDFVWYSGPVAVGDSRIVGETGGPEVAIGLSPWPSDHRAVVSTFAATPARLPALISTGQRVYRTGDDIDVIIRQAGDAGIRVVRIDDDGTESTVTERTVASDGPMRLAGSQFSPGHYRIEMHSLASNVSLYRDIWVLRRDALPSIEVLGTAFAADDAIDILWRNAPGNRNDYVAIARVDAAPGNESESPWAYIDALPQGRLRLGETTSEWGWPPQPGTYVARLMKDDGYEQLAESAPFLIR